jgi:hypothetical protein
MREKGEVKYFSEKQHKNKIESFNFAVKYINETLTAFVSCLLQKSLKWKQLKLRITRLGPDILNIDKEKAFN